MQYLCNEDAKLRFMSLFREEKYFPIAVHFSSILVNHFTYQAEL